MNQSHDEVAEDRPTGDEGRRETRLERYDRNWEELLQELRVAQTGIQVLFGFLLILPFQGGFANLGNLERGLYLAVFGLVTISTLCNLAPVSGHRLLFQRNRKDALVHAGNAFAKAGLISLALALVGATFLVVDLVVGPTIGLISGIVLLILVVVLWFLVPSRLLPRSGEDDSAPTRAR